jgi:hypothetical protein
MVHTNNEAVGIARAMVRALACLAWGVSLLNATPALADDDLHLGLAGTAGLSGFGLDLGVNVNRYVGLRATGASFSLNRNGAYATSVDWAARVKLQQLGLLADVYPFEGAFRLTGGIVKDDNRLDMTATTSGSGSLTFNGNTYPASELSGAQGSVSWGKTVPYLGLGWGNLAGSRGFHLTTDVGLLLTGSATTQLSAQCASGTAGQLCSQATLNADVAAEQAKLQNDANRLKVWPVLRFGIGFAF